MALYARVRGPELPAPTLKDLTTALEDGRFLVAEADGQILACSTLFPVTSATCHTYVGEFTGAFVDPRLRRGKPISMQTLMLGLRVLHHAVLLGDVIEPATNSLITVVKKDNRASIANVLKSGFVECGPQPDWLRYEELSWHGDYVKDEWRYFRATTETVRHLAGRLIAHGLLDWKFALVNARGPIDVSLVGFHDLELAAEDIKQLASGELTIELSDLPQKLIYAGD